MRIENKNRRKKMLIILGILVVVIAGGVGAYVYAHRNDGTDQKDSNGISTGSTEQDKKLEQALKDDPSKKQDSTQTDTPPSPEVDKTTNLQKANAVLTSASQSGDQVSASGFISNVVEADGTCTFVFTSGTKRVEKTSTTLVNPTSTTCKTIGFASSELGAGVWNVQLSYSSPSSAGLSNQMEITIK